MESSLPPPPSPPSPLSPPSDEGALSLAATREASPLGPNPSKAAPPLPLRLPSRQSAAALDSLHSTLLLSRQEELHSLRTLRCVSARARPECPVCYTPYDELLYPSARAADAFECRRHDLCFGCARRLLLVAVASTAELTRKSFRCPLCRAQGCIDRDDGVPTPAWLQLQLSSAEVIAAREEAVRREEARAPLRVRRAAVTAADQLTLLQHLMGGDVDMSALLNAVREADEVQLELEESLDVTAGATDEEAEGSEHTYELGVEGEEDFPTSPSSPSAQSSADGERLELLQATESVLIRLAILDAAARGSAMQDVD